MKQFLIAIIITFCGWNVNAQTLHTFVIDSSHYLTPTYNDTTIAIQYGDSLCVINQIGDTMGFDFWVDDTNYANPPSYSTTWGGITDNDTIVRIKFPVDSLCQWMGYGWNTVEVSFNPPHQNLTIYSANGAFVRRFFFTYPATTSISEQNHQLSNLFLYPSPASDVMHLGGITTEGIRFFIFDLAGNIMQSGLLSPNNNIDISHLSTGTYLIQLSIGGAEKAYKFIKN